MDLCCVTTPIYYINGEPHIGHAYTSIAADIIARFKRLDGFQTHFSTGTDEHGIKVARTAKRNRINVVDFSNIMSQKFRDMSDELNVSYDDFIRTTEERHKKSAQTFWKMLDGEDIYKGLYSGWYSAQDEEYIAEADLDENRRAPSGATVEWMEEESYFFKLSSYQDKLLELYEKNPDFIEPASRRNEVISFVKNGLRDLSISRSLFDWGVPVPYDSWENENNNMRKHVMYVWIDALVNYVTSLGFPNNRPRVSEMMSNCIHIVGKEIIRFHAVYWPAFLMSAGIALPKKIFAHGWWTVNDKKMSKSIGNTLAPHDLIEKYGLDAFRYFLFREVKFGEDGNFSEFALQRRFSYDLANDLGNLIQRVLMFIQKRSGCITVNYNIPDKDRLLFDNARSLINRIRSLMDKLDFYSVLDVIWKQITETNKYVESIKLWKIKDADYLNAALTVLCESIKAIAFGLAPFMPDTAKKIFGFINVKGESFSELSQNFTNQCFPKPSVLFPKERE